MAEYDDLGGLAAQENARQLVETMNLQPDVLARYRKKFDALDLNKDGIVTLSEFASVSKVFGYNLSREEILDIFGRRDLDESGGITFDEFVVAMRNRSGQYQNVNNVRAKFNMYDRKKRGYITADEAFPILQKELGFDEAKTEAIVDMYDKNRDYRLSLMEFVEFQTKVEQLKQQIVAAFAQFDTNRDGFVDVDEAKAIMVPRGCTEAQVEALVRKADRDRDGRLNYSEFAAFWDIPIN